MPKFQCIFCLEFFEEFEITREHAISYCIFPESYLKKIHKNLLTVPSCKVCNQGFSKDEEFFRDFIVQLSSEKSDFADEIFFGAHKRSLVRSRPKLISTMEKMSLVEAYTKSGIYLGKKTAIQISVEDWIKYHRVLGKFIRALFYVEFKKPLPSNFLIKHTFVIDETQIYPYKDHLKWNFEHEDVYMYGYNCVPETLESIWTLVFYKHTVFQSFVAGKVTFEVNGLVG